MSGFRWDDNAAMTQVSEIAPDIFRLATFVPDFNLQFNQFLVRDQEPLLFHTGPRAMFESVAARGRGEADRSVTASVDRLQSSGGGRMRKLA